MRYKLCFASIEPRLLCYCFSFSSPTFRSHFQAVFHSHCVRRVFSLLLFLCCCCFFPCFAYLCRRLLSQFAAFAFAFHLSLVFCFCFGFGFGFKLSVFGLSRCSFASSASSSSSSSSFSYSQRVHLKFAPARAGHSFNFTLNASTTS